MKTPEGDFTIREINDSSAWKHDFKDGLGMIEGAYGPYFIRLWTNSLKSSFARRIHPSVAREPIEVGRCVP